MSINIRKANSSDITILVHNNQALARETEALELNENILRDGIKQALKRNECHYFVAIIDGKVVGQTMITYEWSDWRNGIIWWVQSVYVHRNYRRRGVFRNLFLHIESLARNHPQVKAIRLYVMNNNKTGQHNILTLSHT